MKHSARVPLDPLVDVALDDFRIASPRRIDEMLNRLFVGREEIALHAAGGVYTASLAAMDRAGRSLKLRVGAADNTLLALLASDETIAVALLDSIKLQFALQDPTPVGGGPYDLIEFKVPRELFRFQRRDAYRVRPLWCDSPRATVRLPSAIDTALQLRIVDVSLGGCALLVPKTMPSLHETTLLQNAEIDLDADTAFCVDLQIRNVTPINDGDLGTRLGCEFVNARGDIQRLLQSYLFETERRRVPPARPERS